MTRQDSWVAEWCCDKLISHDEILSAEPISPNGLVLEVKDLAQTVLVAAMSERRACLADVPVEFGQSETEYLLNIPKEAYFDGDLLHRASQIPIGVGGIGDLYVAAAEK